MPLANLGDVELHYKERGEGTPVLGVMGFALDQRFWAAQIPLSPRKTSSSPSITAASVAQPATRSSIDQMADDAYRCESLELDKVVIFGLSMGGAIAQRLILDHPKIGAGSSSA